MTAADETRRVRAANDRAVERGGEYVLYWMIAARRARSNHALDRAVAWARELSKPLVVLEALRMDYPFASDRLHRFVIDGMADNRDAFARTPALYYPYVEPERDAGKGLLSAMAERASVVVTDEFPCFFLPRMVAAAARRVPVRLECVDSNGLLPIHASARTFTAAAHFRRYVQKSVPGALRDWPSDRPFAKARLAKLATVPRAVGRRWPAASDRLLGRSPAALAALDIDHEVGPAPLRGGSVAAVTGLRRFVSRRLASYGDAHRHPDDRGTSRL